MEQFNCTALEGDGDGRYLAPERLKNEEGYFAHPSADIFSLGVTFWAMAMKREVLLYVLGNLSFIFSRSPKTGKSSRTQSNWRTEFFLFRRRLNLFCD
jgi:hypothetical protein